MRPLAPCIRQTLRPFTAGALQRQRVVLAVAVHLGASARRHPICLTEAQKAEVETLAAVLTAEQVADYFGIGRRTFYSMMEQEEEIAARYKRGKAKVIGVIAQGLIIKARSGDTASMILFLKTQAGWRETASLEHRLENKPEDNGNAKDTLARFLDQIAERQRQARAIEDAAQWTVSDGREGAS